MPPLLHLQKLPGKGNGGWKKVSLCHGRIWADQKIVSSWKKWVLGHPISRATSYCLLPDTYWLRASKNAFTVGSAKFANWLSPPSLWRKYAPEVKAAEGLKRCRAKIKGVNSPAWTAQFKVSRFYWAFCPWGLESEVTFAHDIHYEQVHKFY